MSPRENEGIHEGSHQVKCLRETIDATGAGLLHLASYSPDFNPIENTFAKLIALLRKAAERTVEGLWNVIDALLSAFTPRECANYFCRRWIPPGLARKCSNASARRE